MTSTDTTTPTALRIPAFEGNVRAHAELLEQVATATGLEVRTDLGAVDMVARPGQPAAGVVDRWNYAHRHATPAAGEGGAARERDCTACRGIGRVTYRPCLTCQGDGRTTWGGHAIPIGYTGRTTRCGDCGGTGEGADR